MRGRRASMIVVALFVAAMAATAVAGCTGGVTEEPLKPKVAPPVIGKAGVLRAAIDLGYPPFGGIDKGRKVGLDIDVASALAESLGLKLEILDATPAEGAAMLADKRADVMLGGLPIEGVVAAGAAFAGGYIDDGPAVFTSTGTTYTIETIGGKRVAVQTGSTAYWTLLDAYGESGLIVTPTLREALDAAAKGQAEAAAGDAIVTGYMLRDFPTLKFSGQIAPASPVGVAVARDATKLEQAVRASLNDLATRGVFDALRRKWVGDLPELEGSVESSDALEPSAEPEPVSP